MCCAPVHVRDRPEDPLPCAAKCATDNQPVN